MKIVRGKNLSLIGIVLTPTCTNLLNLISGRDASYPYLISKEPKKWYTNYV